MECISNKESSKTLEGQHDIIDSQNQSKKEIEDGNLQLKSISKLWAQKSDPVHPNKPQNLTLQPTVF